MRLNLDSFLVDKFRGKSRFRILVFLAIIIVGFIPIRGLLVLALNKKALTPLVYSATLTLTLLISFLSVKLSLKSTLLNFPKKLSNLLLINLVFYLIWTVPLLFFNPVVDWIMSPIYLGFMPYLVYIFQLIDLKTLINIMAFVTIIIGISVLWDFVEMNIMLDRYDIAFARQELLRPENFDAIGRNDGLVRPNGILGSRPHDASNLMAMFFVFWIAKYFFVKNKNKLGIIFLILLSGVSMLATQVASNILAAFLVLAFIIPYGFTKYSGKVPYLGILGITVLLIYVFSRYPLVLDALMSGFQRAGAEGDWEGITVFEISNLTDIFLTFIIGHAGSFHLFHAAEVTEFAIVRMVFEQGILHFILLLMIFFYPFKLFFRARKKLDPIILPFIGAVAVGLVSLWHYGSVFRITNGVIFWAFYAYSIALIQNKSTETGK